MRIALTVIVFAQGLAQLVGFVVPWRNVILKEMRTKPPARSGVCIRFKTVWP